MQYSVNFRCCSECLTGNFPLGLYGSRGLQTKHVKVVRFRSRSAVFDQAPLRKEIGAMPSIDPTCHIPAITTKLYWIFDPLAGTLWSSSDRILLSLLLDDPYRRLMRQRHAIYILRGDERPLATILNSRKVPCFCDLRPFGWLVGLRQADVLGVSIQIEQSAGGM